MDRPVWLRYPGGNGGQAGEPVTLAYNLAGLPQSITGTLPYVPSTTYDAAGRVELRALGSTVLQQGYVYYPWTTYKGSGRVQQLKTGTTISPTALQDLRYTYDAGGNVLTILDNKAGGAQTQTFHYDSLDRLLDATASGGTGGTYSTEYYTYNPIGNLTGKAGVTQWYSDTLHQHALTHLNGVQKFWYDANGNMLTRNDSTGNFTQQWDKENRLITATATGITGYFVYDGDGNRVKATLNGVTTAYVGNYYEQSGSVTTTYYYAGGTRLAMRQGSIVNYLLSDQLGSTAMAANGTTGALIAEQRYKPWGEQRYPTGASTLPTRHRFTGQIEDIEIGLYFYGARMYSAVLGRFLSADTLVPSPNDPQQLNRYAYASNNPVKYTDPTGHDTECGMGESGCRFKSQKIRNAQKLVSEQIVGGGNLTWNELTPEQRDDLSMLSPGTLDGNPIYWSEHRWNVETLHECGACSVAGTSMDPAVWIAEFILFRKVGQWLPEALGTSAENSATIMENGIVYRGGSKTAVNLTPRPGIDTTGLSTFESLEQAVNPGGKAQVIDVSRLQSLIAIKDPPPAPVEHVSLTVNDAELLSEWAATRGTSFVHQLTQEVMKAIVGEVRRSK